MDPGSCHHLAIPARLGREAQQACGASVERRVTGPLHSPGCLLKLHLEGELDQYVLDAMFAFVKNKPGSYVTRPPRPEAHDARGLV